MSPAVLACAAMGSKGSKARKPQHSQHLPKVGTKADNDREQRGERKAVMDQMGLGNASKGTKTAFTVVIALLVIGAILGLLLLTVFK